MSLITINYNSKHLGFSNNISVIFPDRDVSAGEEPAEFFGKAKKYKALWLLHGAQGDYSWYTRYTSIERFAQERDIVVVMPNANNSIYLDWPKYGIRGMYFLKFFFEELMPMIYGLLPVSDQREDNYLAGFSMGSFGAMHIMNEHPELFCGVIAMASPPFDYRGAKGIDDVGIDRNIVKSGESFEDFLNGPHNIYARLQDKVRSGIVMPKLYWACGKNDPSFKRMGALEDFCSELGLNVHWKYFDNLAHETRFVDAALEDAFDYFGLSKKRIV